MRASVIVPALDEASRIADTLGPLQSLRSAGHEIIVVDGGSRDRTLAIAQPLADRAFVARRGRARQMNAGAAAATGDVLLFLHADSRLAPEGVAMMIDGISRGHRRWGRFDVTIDGASPLLKIVAATMNARSRLTGIATGDQGIFVDRALFQSVGGFPDQPLMEDIELSSRLKRRVGPPLCLSHRVVTSGRRWEAHGTLRTILAMWRTRVAYACGADPRWLVKSYARIGDRDDPRRAATLLVFAKDPVPGTVKTRLARTLGPDRAASVYVQLAERTLATAVAARDAGIVDRIEMWCAPDAERPLFTEWRDRYRVELATQHGEDLGTRMRYALESALARGVPALLIGTDCPALDIGTLACARAELAHHDAVFVPAEDGGYVLIGLVRPVDAFSGIEWSVPGVMAATRLKLAAQHATWRELPPLWDVDVAEDLARWEALDRHDCTDERRAFALRSPGSTLTAGYDPDDPVGIRRGRHPPSRCSP